MLWERTVRERLTRASRYQEVVQDHHRETREAPVAEIVRDKQHATGLSSRGRVQRAGGLQRGGCPQAGRLAENQVREGKQAEVRTRQCLLVSHSRAVSPLLSGPTSASISTRSLLTTSMVFARAACHKGCNSGPYTGCFST